MSSQELILWCMLCNIHSLTIKEQIEQGKSKIPLCILFSEHGRCLMRMYCILFISPWRLCSSICSLYPRLLHPGSWPCWIMTHLGLASLVPEARINTRKLSCIEPHSLILKYIDIFIFHLHTTQYGIRTKVSRLIISHFFLNLFAWSRQLCNI